MSTIPDWIFKFYGHRPFMSIGYRMRILTMKNIGVFKSWNHKMHVIPEMRIDYLQNRMMSLTGAILGKGWIINHPLTQNHIGRDRYFI